MDPKKNLIEVISETKNANNKNGVIFDEDDSYEEEIDIAELLARQQGNLDIEGDSDEIEQEEPPKPQKLENKNASKDLLRLEKDYFNGVSHINTKKMESEFAIKKMLNDQKPKEKPKFEDVDSSSFKEFMPMFKKDTEDLLVDEERKQKMNIDVIDEPANENDKVVEMNLLLGVFDMKPKTDHKVTDLKTK